MVFNNVFGGEMDIWPILPEGDIYRIVIDYSHSCYRVEDNRFRIIYAGDLPSGGSDSIIFALADRVPGEDRGRFLTAFSEKRLRNACAKNRREIKLICNRRDDVGKRSIVRAKIGGSPRDLCVELRYQL